MNKVVVIVVIALSLLSCATAIPQAYQLGNGVFETYCNGVLNNWSNCHKSANQECGGYYIVIDKEQILYPPEYYPVFETTIYPIDRRLVFSCN
ncbi:hypothetical protein [Pelagibaculum spongiae]|uniref:hypothetical protein n=1 Tax=Pelagibaculum spongiae TaxID=2080658 RepID=UPI001057A3C6|nr:hypothetical protein [Pelagibaculum spongiae]